MISTKDVYNVVKAIVPLYVAMLLAYLSVRYWKIFTPEHCVGINEFVARFSIPLITFRIISTYNPYEMDLRLALSDILQKVLALLAVALVIKTSSKVKLNWMMTGMSLLTIPNSLIVGVPLIKAMYGSKIVGFLVQLVVMQGFLWNVVILFLYELNSAENAHGQAEVLPEVQEKEDGQQEHTVTQIQRRSKIIKICLTIAKKLSRNPNIHATVAGLTWALISFRWGLKFPTIIDDSISILSDGSLGMAMFSLGLFIGLQASIISCGPRMAIVTVILRFLASPALMALSSIALGLRGSMLRFAIVQAAFPQAVVSFVFSRQYNVHPEILSTGITLTTLLAIPITLAYYFFLALV